MPANVLHKIRRHAPFAPVGVHVQMLRWRPFAPVTILRRYDPLRAPRFLSTCCGVAEFALHSMLTSVGIPVHALPRPLEFLPTYTVEACWNSFLLLAPVMIYAQMAR